MGSRRIATVVAAGVLVASAVTAGVLGYRLLAPHLATASTRGGADISVAGAATPSPSPSPPRSAGAGSDARPVPSSLRVATIGDSIMAGNGLAASQAWPVLLGESEGVAVSNLGCGGAGFIAVGECDTDYSGLVEEAVADQPDVVIIQSSDNDFGQDDGDIDAATHATVASLRAALPAARIVGLSTLWDQPGELPAQVASTSDDLRDAVESVGGTFIDLGQPLADQAMRNGEYGTAGDGTDADGTDTDGTDADDGDAAGGDGAGDGPTPVPSPAPIASPAPPVLQGDFEHPTAAGQQLLAESIRAALDASGIHL